MHLNPKMTDLMSDPRLILSDLPTYLHQISSDGFDKIVHTIYVPNLLDLDIEIIQNHE